MARQRIKLPGPEACAQVNEWLCHNEHLAVRDRLRALQMAFTGEFTYAQIAAAVGRSASTLQRWFGWYREAGLTPILERTTGHGGGHPETLNNDEVRSFLREGLEEGKWRTCAQAAEALSEARGQSYRSKTVWEWLKKLAGTMRVPRPMHRQRDPEKAAEFKATKGTCR